MKIESYDAQELMKDLLSNVFQYRYVTKAVRCRVNELLLNGTDNQMEAFWDEVNTALAKQLKSVDEIWVLDFTLKRYSAVYEHGAVSLQKRDFDSDISFQIFNTDRYTWRDNKMNDNAPYIYIKYKENKIHNLDKVTVWGFE